MAAATLICASLAAAGATYQGLFRNPLVSPDILGVAAGAGLGAVLGIFLSRSVVVVQALAFLGGLAAVLVAFLICAAMPGPDPVLGLWLAAGALGSPARSALPPRQGLPDP